MKAQAGEPLDLEALTDKVVAILVRTFDFPEAEARQRVTLWRARQHHLEGQALETLLPELSAESQAQQLLRWALEGQEVENELLAGAAALRLDVDPPPD
ncbi:MAG: hypothetical protein U0931_05040 [Vulcanimicrobiota bacterium]